MIQWEYFDFWVYPHESHPQLNELGNDGWELVSVVYIAHNEAVVYYFKRPLSTADKIFNDVRNEVEGGHMEVKTTS